VGATLEVSYQALGETEGGEALQLCWLALATFPETFDRSGAAAVSGLLEGPNNINDLEIVLEMIDDQLIELVNSSLVQWDETRQWYRLHDMAREFARKRQSPTQWEAFARRHSAHYCQLLATANRFYLTGNDDVENGLALFDLERRNIEAGQAWAAQRVEVDDSAASLCSEYANAGGDILDLRLDRREYIRWLENALMAARRLNNRNAQGAHMGNLGNIYMDLGEPESAVELNVQHASLARETGDELGEGAALGNLGNAYAAMGETQSAINFYQQYLAIARKIGNRRGEGIVIGNLGSAYAALGETRVAIMYHEKALVIAREIGDRRGEATEVGNLGLAFASLNGIERAVDHHEQALAIARALGDRSEEARTLFNLSDAYTAIGETQSAISLKEQYLAIAHELGDRRGEGNAHWQIALALEMLGKRENAIESAESALKIYDAIEPQNAIAVRKILKEWTRDQRGERPSG
jgi:tetratricopeptide (TPR) repeat protein